MIDIAVRGLVKAYEVDKNILDGLDLLVQQGERVGILGKNGAGKTTLFKILTGQIDFDTGEVSIATGKRIGLISQIPVYPEGYLTEDVLRDAHRRQYDLQGRLDRLSKQLETDSSPVLLRQYDEALATFEAQGGYQLDAERNRVAGGLDITDEQRAQPFATLSGGEQTRVNLARLILEDTDILLLDEPTNHLDMRSTEWLEDYLQKFHGTVLVISHDRYFLDSVTSRTVEIVHGKSELYSGSYSFYVDEKARREAEQIKRYSKEQAEVSRLQEAADRLHGWGTGNKRLAQKSKSIQTRIARMDRTMRPERQRALKGKLEETEFFGDIVFTLHDISKSYGERTLFEGVELTVTGGERIGIIGDNGAGKTTFLKALIGEESPDGGEIRFGPSVKRAYLPQHVTFENPERSVLDTMIYGGYTPQEARDRLGAFQFYGEDVYTPVSLLSGGEKSRLRLCMLLGQAINLLILDEPTNHLDLYAREWVETLLDDYGEALLFVSHDRYFVSRFATRIWLLENGTLTDYRCGFEEFQEKCANEGRFEQIQKEAARKEKKKKRSRSPEKELARLEREIAALEQERDDLTAQEAESATDYEALLSIQRKRAELEEKLEASYDEWETAAADMET